MSQELFGELTRPAARASTSSGRMLGLSLVAHSIGVALIVAAPLAAPIVMPAHHDPPAIVTIPVTSEIPSPPPPPAVRPHATDEAVSRDVAPLVAPDRIHEERPPSVTVPAGVIGGIDCVAAVGGGCSGAPVGGPGLTLSPPPPPPVATPPAPVRPGGHIRAPEKVHHVVPVYPPIARSSRIEGLVILEAIIAPDGAVRDVRVLRSHPLLEGAAIEAVRQWRYRPTLLNGVPVAVVMTVTLTFQLQ